MQVRLQAVSVLVALGSTLAWGQQPTKDLIGEALFSPELVMKHQQRIQLSQAQKSFLKTEMRTAQRNFIELQWRLQDEMEKMLEMLKQDQVDEEHTLDQLQRVLEVEREIKRAQFTLLIRIRNELTPQQRNSLQQLKRQTEME